MEDEKWVRVIGFGPGYWVSSLGRVMSKKRYPEGKILSTSVSSVGYLQVGLFVDGKVKTTPVHRLVASHFIPNKYVKPHVNHKNGIKTDSRAGNLEWCTVSENRVHAYESGLQSAPCGERHGASKLSIEDVRFIRSVYKPRDKNLGATALAKRFGVSQSTVSEIISGKKWRNER